MTEPQTFLVEIRDVHTGSHMCEIALEELLRLHLELPLPPAVYGPENVSPSHPEPESR